MDGPGVVHLAVQLTRVPPVDHLWGSLFKITFKIVGNPGTAIVITDSTLSAIRGTPLEHTTSHGKYAQPPEVLSAYPSFVIVGKRGSNDSIVTLTGLANFVGTIRLKATVLSNTIFPAFRPRLELNPSKLSLADGQTTTSTLIINGTAITTTGTYTVNIVGISSLMPSFTSITVLVPQVYLLHEFQYPLTVHRGEFATLTSTLKNLGERSVRVVSVIVKAEFGTFTIFSATPGGITLCGQDYAGAIVLASGDEKVLSGNLTVPTCARVGNHTATAEVYWQYPDVLDIYGNPVTLWCSGPAIVLKPSFLVLEGNEPPSQPNPPPNLFNPAQLDLAQLVRWMRAGFVPAVGLYAGLTVLAIVLVFRERRRKGKPF